jgi:hypothetical protein
VIKYKGEYWSYVQKKVCKCGWWQHYWPCSSAVCPECGNKDMELKVGRVYETTKYIIGFPVSSTRQFILKDKV